MEVKEREREGEEEGAPACGEHRFPRPQEDGDEGLAL